MDAPSETGPRSALPRGRNRIPLLTLPSCGRCHPPGLGHNTPGSINTRRHTACTACKQAWCPVAEGGFQKELRVHKVIALFLTTLLSAPSAALASAAAGPPSDLISTSSRTAGTGPLATAAAREVIRLASLTDDAQPSANPQPTEERSWAGRHPVVTGTLLGAGIGAAYGAASCSDGCFPIGAGGAAILLASFGAGFGALAGVIVKLARQDP